MIINHNSPGVYPITTDMSDYVPTISGTPVGIVGGATKGRLTVTTMTDVNDLYRMFGYPVENDYGLRVAEQVLLAKGTVLFQRIIKRGTKATAGDKGTDAFVFTAKDEGPTTNKVVISNSTSNTFDLAVKTSDDKVLESFTSLSVDGSSPSNVSRVLSSNSKYITALVIPKKAVSDKEYQLSGGTTGATYGTAGESGTDNILFTTRTYDSTLNGAVVEVTDKKPDGYFDFVLSKGNVVLEKITSLSDDPKDTRYFVDTINKYSEYVTVVFDSSVHSTVSAKRLSIQHGTDGISGITTAEVIEGLRSFYNEESTDIRVLTAPGYTDVRVAKFGDSVAASREDCEFLVDLPRHVVEPQDCVDYINGKGEYEGVHDAIGTEYSACYSPWMTIYDDRLQKDVEVPPSVLVAPAYVNSDRLGKPWSAPAGLTRGKITTPVKLLYNYNQLDRDLLCGTRNCVNPIIKYHSEGIVIWGQRTMQRRPSSLDRVGAMRLVQYLKRAIKLRTAYLVFEGSNKTMWDQWKLSVEPILEECKLQGGLYDYRIEMSDKTTISMSNIDNHIAPGVIRLLITKTAEVIPIDFQLYSGGISFKDSKFEGLEYLKNAKQ